MARPGTTDHLRTFSISKKREVDRFKQGVLLEGIFKCTISELELEVAKDRFSLAKECLRGAKRSLKQNPVSHRLVVSRSYYAMYHAVRAVVFLAHGGDDYEAHDKLPGQLPNDFNRRDTWENSLKSARLDRNRADYEPYPKTDAAFRGAAFETCRAAQDLIKECGVYLRSRGCKV